MKMEECEEKLHYHTIHQEKRKCGHRNGFIYCFEITSISTHSFSEGDQVIVSGCNGEWGLFYGNIDSIQSHSEGMVVIVSSMTQIVIPGIPSPVSHLFRIYRYRSVDLS